MSSSISFFDTEGFKIKDIIEIKNDGYNGINYLQSLKKGGASYSPKKTPTTMSLNGVTLTMPKLYYMEPDSNTPETGGNVVRYLSPYYETTTPADTEYYNVLLPAGTFSYNSSRSNSGMTYKQATTYSNADCLFYLYNDMSSSYAKFQTYDNLRFRITTDGPSIFVPYGDNWIGMGIYWHLITGSNVNDTGRQQTQFQLLSTEIDGIKYNNYAGTFQDYSQYAESATSSYGKWTYGMYWSGSQSRYVGPGPGYNYKDFPESGKQSFYSGPINLDFPKVVFFEKSIEFNYSYRPLVWFAENTSGKTYTYCIERIFPLLQGVIYKIG